MDVNRGEKGMVTAETAVTIPFLVLVVVTLLWLVSLGLAQVRLVDAAREGARLVARGDTDAAAVAAAQRNAPQGMRLSIDNDGSLIEVEAQVVVRSPLAGLPPVTLHARAVAADEGP